MQCWYFPHMQSAAGCRPHSCRATTGICVATARAQVCMRAHTVRRCPILLVITTAPLQIPAPPSAPAPEQALPYIVRRVAQHCAGDIPGLRCIHRRALACGMQVLAEGGARLQHAALVRPGGAPPWALPCARHTCATRLQGDGTALQHVCSQGCAGERPQCWSCPVVRGTFTT